MLAAKDEVRGELLKKFGLVVDEIHSLGGKYRPSIGITPEVIYPTFGEINAHASKIDGVVQEKK